MSAQRAKRPTLTLKAKPAPKPAPAKQPKAKIPDQKPLPTRERRRREGEKAKAGLAILREAYPALFDGQNPVPLAIGIDKQLQQERHAGRLEIASLVMSRALHRWVKSAEYLERLAQGGTRFDLFGQEAGEVDAEAIESAARELAEKLERRQAGAAKAGKAQPSTAVAR